MAPRDPLLVLGLRPGATLAVARKKFKEMALLHHPDKNGDPKIFADIKDAMDTITTNPDILKAKTAKNRKPAEPIVVELPVPVESAYWYLQLPVEVTRQEKCSACAGTGSSDSSLHLCDTCDGTGEIGGAFYREVADGDPMCPSCRGTGLEQTDVPPCPTCFGTGLEVKQALLKVRIGLQDLGNGVVECRDAGSFGPNGGPNGGLILKLSKKGSCYMRNGVLHAVCQVSPARFILGGDVCLPLAGEDLMFTLPARTDTVDAVHMKKPVVIDVRVKWGAPSTQERALYEQLLGLSP